MLISRHHVVLVNAHLVSQPFGASGVSSSLEKTDVSTTPQESLSCSATELYTNCYLSEHHHLVMPPNILLPFQALVSRAMLDIIYC